MLLLLPEVSCYCKYTSNHPLQNLVPQNDQTPHSLHLDTARHRHNYKKTFAIQRKPQQNTGKMLSDNRSSQSHSSFSSLRTLCEEYSVTILRQSESVIDRKEVLVQKMSDTTPICFNYLFVLHSICIPPHPRLLLFNG